jgi:hypothetical protein
VTSACGNGVRGGMRGESQRLGWVVLLLLLLVGFFPSVHANADEIRPALLDIKEQSTGLFAVTWKVPTRNGQALAIAPRLPASLERVGSPSEQDQPRSALRRLVREGSVRSRRLFLPEPSEEELRVLLLAVLAGEELAALLWAVLQAGQQLSGASAVAVLERRTGVLLLAVIQVGQKLWWEELLVLLLWAVLQVGQELSGASAVAVLERRAGRTRHRPEDGARHSRTRTLLRLCADICATPYAIARAIQRGRVCVRDERPVSEDELAALFCSCQNNRRLRLVQRRGLGSFNAASLSLSLAFHLIILVLRVNQE